MGRQKTSKPDVISDQRHRWFISEDLCESSFKLSFRFGTSWLKAFMQILAIASLVTNVVLITQQTHEAAGFTVNRLLTDLNVPNAITNGPTVSTVTAMEGDLQGTTASDDIIEQPPIPMSNTSFMEEIVVSIRSTNRILADEKRDTRKKRQAYRKAKRPFVGEQSKLSLSPKADLSACLLVKDDNDILSEWIAYHYHALNMRFLIVAVDPHSIQSPSSILAKWKLLTDLEIIEWNDEMYMPQYFLKNGQAPLKYLQKSRTAMDLEA